MPRLASVRRGITVVLLGLLLLLPGHRGSLRAQHAPAPAMQITEAGLPPVPPPVSRHMAQQLQRDPSLMQEWLSHRPSTRALVAPAAPSRTGGSWTQGSPAPVFGLGNPLLLTDGTVIAHAQCSRAWYRLTPDSGGNYATGTWSKIASLPLGYDPLYFSSAVLPDGRVIIEGGEYNKSTKPCGLGPSWTNLGAIYDPTADSWTAVAPPSGWKNVGDAPGIVLADGTYMQSDCCFAASVRFGGLPMAALLDAGTLTWAATGDGKADDYNEEGWTLLPDGSVLTVDAGVDPVNAPTCSISRNDWETYDPNTGSWTRAALSISVQLADCASPKGLRTSFEMGPQVLRPDGTVVAFGGTACSRVSDARCSGLASGFVVTTQTAIYDANAGSWSVGPPIPAVGGENYTLADAPAALLPSGNILFAASPNYVTFAKPTRFFEYGADNSIVQVGNAPGRDAGATSSFLWNFLVLPNGQVMATDQSSLAYFYTPRGSPDPGWAPTIASVSSLSLTAGQTYTLSGTQLNGLSQGAAYGDDVQASTNYPLVRITSHATGHVFYARTFGHSTMSVAPAAAGSTNFTIAAETEMGPGSLVVIANGIASRPVKVRVR